jgi:small subunit ribosomal protein S20
MNKKQKNRKIIQQNNRNFFINRRYISTIKKLKKSLKFLVISLSEEKIENDSVKEKTNSLIRNLYSILDKAAKKKVIHKNAAARKKSSLMKLLKKFSYL